MPDSAPGQRSTRIGLQATDLRLTRETDAEVRFTHRRWPALGVALFGVAILLLLSRAAEKAPLWVYAAVSLFPFLGTLVFWWHEELTLDLARRQCTRRRGFWPAIRTVRRSLDELSAVVLSRDTVRDTTEHGGTVQIAFHNAALILVLFGVLFGGFALFAFLAALRILPVEVTGSRGVMGGIASTFVLVGAGIASLPFLATHARQEVREDGEALVFCTRLFGRPFSVKRLLRREIEEIDVRDDTMTHQSGGSRFAIDDVSVALPTRADPSRRVEVFVRSDGAIARLGSDLSESGRAWLRDTLRTLARS